MTANNPTLVLVACGSRRLAASIIEAEAHVPSRHPRLRYATGPCNLRAMPRGTLLVDLIEPGELIERHSRAEANEMREIIRCRAYTPVSLVDLAKELARIDSAGGKVT